MSRKANEIGFEEFAGLEPEKPAMLKKKTKRKKEKVVKEEKPVDEDQVGKRAMGWFLTWPHCPYGKEKILEHLKEKLAKEDLKIKEYVICDEKHKDGDLHSHAFIKLNKRVSWNATRWDVFEKHGNYQVAKSWDAVRHYVEEDGDYISSFDVKSAMKKKGKMNKTDLLRPVDDVLDEGIITPMQVSAFYKNQCAYKMLTAGMKPIPKNMPPKQRHMWIYGASNTGKTQDKLDWIREHGEDNCFQIPYNGDWVGYADQKYLYADEFKGQLSIQEINRICDGGAKMNVKGATVQLRWDVEVMICSNYEIQECYAKADKVVVQALYNRFIVKEKLWDPDYKKKMDDLAKERDAKAQEEPEAIPDEIVDML